MELTREIHTIAKGAAVITDVRLAFTEVREAIAALEKKLTMSTTALEEQISGSVATQNSDIRDVMGRLYGRLAQQ